MPAHEDPDRPAEVPLLGGTTNHGRVVRVGDTVRRPLRPTSPATEHLLEHLAVVGFDGAPRFLGVDGQGRETLSYVEGEAVTPPYPDWALTDEALASVATLLRRFHDAVESYDPGGQRWPDAVPERHREGGVSHNDPNLDNVVFRDGRAAALIDFDLAGPGSRRWDVAAALRLWVPLRRDEDVPDARRGRAADRARVFLSAYGGLPDDRDLLGETVLAQHDASYAVIAGAVAQGHPAFADYLAAGAAGRATRTRRWYVEGGLAGVLPA